MSHRPLPKKHESSPHFRLFGREQKHLLPPAPCWRAKFRIPRFFLVIFYLPGVIWPVFSKNVCFVHLFIQFQLSVSGSITLHKSTQRCVFLRIIYFVLTRCMFQACCFYLTIYVVQDHVNGTHNEIRTHSSRFVSWMFFLRFCIDLYRGHWCVLDFSSSSSFFSFTQNVCTGLALQQFYLWFLICYEFFCCFTLIWWLIHMALYHLYYLTKAPRWKHTHMKERNK